MGAALVFGGAYALGRRLRAQSLGRVVGPGLGLTGIVALAFIAPGAGQRDVVMPERPAPLTFEMSPSSTQLEALIHVAPENPETWLAVGHYLDQYETTDPGVVAYERALLLNPSQQRAALALAAIYLRLGSLGGPVNAEVAAYYTALAGYTSPPLPRGP